MNTKILVAEDEADVLRLVATNLKAAGFEVVKSANGHDALPSWALPDELEAGSFSR